MSTTDELTTAVSDGVRSGIISLLKDEEVMAKFWSAGYKQLTEQATNNTTQWLGKRLLAVVLTAIFIWTLTWLVRSGGLK